MGSYGPTGEGLVRVLWATVSPAGCARAGKSWQPHLPVTLLILAACGREGLVLGTPAISIFALDIFAKSIFAW